MKLTVRCQRSVGVVGNDERLGLRGTERHGGSIAGCGPVARAVAAIVTVTWANIPNFSDQIMMLSLKYISGLT